jgi:hypothetical protein
MSYATIRSLFESAFASSYGALDATGALDYDNATAICTNAPVANYSNADVDNGIASICTDGPSYSSPAFNPGTADYDNADIFPRSEINAGVALIYDNVQEAPPDSEHVVLSIGFPSTALPVICSEESNVEFIRGSIQISCYTPRGRGMKRLEELAQIGVQTLVGMPKQADPNGVRPRIGNIEGPTPVLSGAQPYALSVVSATFTANG